MDSPGVIVWLAAFVLIGGGVVWSMFSGEAVGSVEATRRSMFGGSWSATLTVRRVGSGSQATARLQASGGGGYRALGLSRANSSRCAELLERFAQTGRITEDSAGVAVTAGIQIAPDFEDGRAVAVIFPADSDSMELRLLLTPSQAKLVAAWLRTAVAPGGTLAEARSNARIAEEKRQGRSPGPHAPESADSLGFPPPAD